MYLSGRFFTLNYGIALTCQYQQVTTCYVMHLLSLDRPILLAIHEPMALNNVLILL